MAARASAVIVTEAEAVGGTHGIVTGQVVHTRNLALPEGHSWGGSGGGQGGAEMDQKKKNFIVVILSCVYHIYQFLPHLNFEIVPFPKRYLFSSVF